MATADSGIRLIIDSRLENVQWVSGAIASFSRQLGLDDMNCYQIETCVAEAINNSIIHAYQKQPGNQVEIIWRVHEHYLQIEVHDSGIGLKKMPKPQAPSLNQESGRGWFIIQEWMDEVSYCTEEGTNKLSMEKRFL